MRGIERDEKFSLHPIQPISVPCRPPGAAAEEIKKVQEERKSTREPIEISALFGKEREVPPKRERKAQKRDFWVEYKCRRGDRRPLTFCATAHRPPPPRKRGKERSIPSRLLTLLLRGIGFAK